LLGLGLLGLLLGGGVVVSYILGRAAPAPVVSEDWPALAAAAENAIRQRSVPAMKSVRERIQVLQQRPPSDSNDAIRQTLTRLEKALAFRESITEKGLVLGLVGQVTCVAFSPDDHWLAAGQTFGDSGAIVWDGHTGEKLHTLWPRRGNATVQVLGLAFAHDRSVLAVASADGAGIRLWYPANGKEETLPVGPGVTRVLSVAFSPSSRNLVAGFEPVTEGLGRPYLKIWNLDTGQSPFLFKAEHSGKIASLAYCTGGEQVASGSHDKRVVLWNAETGRIWRELRTGLTIAAVACSPQGRTFAVAGQAPEGAVLQFWDYAGERRLATKPSPGACRCVAFARQGALLASGSGSNLCLWNADTQELLATLRGHGQDITSLAFSSEGGILASGSHDQTLRLWDVTRFLPSSPP